jgi:hypothetical protein
MKSSFHSLIPFLPSLLNHLTAIARGSLNSIPYLSLSESRVTLQLAVYHQSVHLGAKNLETQDQYFFNWTLAVIVLMKHLWWEDKSVVYNCCWPSPAQSVSGPSPAGFMPIIYCRLLQPEAPSPRIYILQEQGGPVIPLGNGFPFRRLLQLAGLRM